MRNIGRAAAGAALTVALLAMAAAGAQAARRHHPHLVVHPRHLEAGEQFEVRGFGFPAGEEVALGECNDHAEQFFPLECDETYAEVTVGESGVFSASVTAETCPVEEETGHARRWCYVGVFDRVGEDGFGLKPYVVVNVR